MARTITKGNDSWRKDEDMRFFSLSASNGDLSRLGSGERNLTEDKGPRGPSERARASHWAWVRCRKDEPPEGNANFAWVQHCIRRSHGEGGHLALAGAGTSGGMAGLNAVRKDLANGSMSSNQSGDRNARSGSLQPKAKPQSLPRQRDIRRALIEADLVDCMVATFRNN